MFINNLLILVYLISSVLLDVVFFSFYLTPCNVQKIPILILIHTSIFKLSFIKKIVSVSYLKYSKSILLVSIYMYFYLNTQPSKNIYLINFGKNGYFVLLKKFYIIFFIVNLESFYFWKYAILSVNVFYRAFRGIMYFCLFLIRYNIYTGFRLPILTVFFWCKQRYFLECI